MKDHVDTFTPGTLLPYCQLRLEWIGKRKPVALCQAVTLTGAKAPFNFITIESDPLQTSTVDKGDIIMGLILGGESHSVVIKLLVSKL